MELKRSSEYCTITLIGYVHVGKFVGGGGDLRCADQRCARHTRDWRPDRLTVPTQVPYGSPTPGTAYSHSTYWLKDMISTISSHLEITLVLA